jgi:uncharacterized protein
MPTPRSGTRPLLILFTRVPRSGQVKTRLIPALGPEGAAELHRRMGVHAVLRARRAALRFDFDLEVHVDGPSGTKVAGWLGGGLPVHPQGEGDLGRRMSEALAGAFRRGKGPCVLVGADCPEYDEGTLGQAFSLLRRKAVVLGPARDGGYYLIGLSRFEPALFEEIAWGTESVFQETLERADRLGLSVGLLPEYSDVDGPEDLPVWEAARAREERPPSLSVIIPTLDEEARLPWTLATVLNEPMVEAVVVDGGSSDATCRSVESYGARLVRARRGRAHQQNVGAEEARGEHLLFLHADTLLPPGFGPEVCRALGRTGVAGGAFSFRLDSRRGPLRWVERGANLRSRLFGLPYGDQALFLRAEVFRGLGGFPEQPLLEDLELVWRLRRLGRIVILPLPATTSARRWLTGGLWKTSALHLLAALAWFAGVPAERVSELLSALGYRGGGGTCRSQV